jgi:hypothetical protein
VLRRNNVQTNQSIEQAHRCSPSVCGEKNCPVRSLVSGQLVCACPHNRAYSTTHPWSVSAMLLVSKLRGSPPAFGGGGVSYCE